MNDAEFKGDLYYLDPAGDSWKITQRPGERNPKQHYWHAERMRGDKAHRVSASAYRLLLGIDDYVLGESGHDGATEENSDEENDNDAKNSVRQITREITDEIIDNLESRRQAYLG